MPIKVRRHCSLGACQHDVRPFHDFYRPLKHRASILWYPVQWKAHRLTLPGPIRRDNALHTRSPWSYSQDSNRSNASRTSLATPPSPLSPSTSLITRLTRSLFIPPRGPVHNFSPATSSLAANASMPGGGAVPPVAGFRAFGTASGVRREGGSMVRIARRLSEFDPDLVDV